MKFGKALAALGLAAGALTATAAAPAVADSTPTTQGCNTGSIWYSHVEIQVDNCPGSGQSWA
ncbi:hypothetical protein ACGFZQ_37045 [Streptomyces sp. NPDC048254]|uniref:hypothetical protein n=1 Tax=Streptomyces sp. NPDC048254 TaxID=3365525 RepID=UPI0037110ED5